MLSISLGKHSHEDRNPSFHLGYPTEGENEDDNRGINNLLQLLNSMLQFQRPASWSQIPEEHFLAEETVPPDSAAHSSSMPCTSDPVRTVQKYLLINHAVWADNPPQGNIQIQSIQWWKRSIKGQGLFPAY